jgi:hypothetical protein
VAVLAVAVCAGAATSAFTTHPTVSAGVAVSNAAYTFDAGGRTVTAVELELEHAAGVVAVSLAPLTASAEWQTCGAAVALRVTCTFDVPVSVAHHLRLRVVTVGAVAVSRR